MDGTPTSSDTTTRKGLLDDLDRIIDEVPKRFPGQDINFEVWKDSINLKFDLKEVLDTETYEMVNNYITSATQPDLSQGKIDAALDKARGCLDSYQELLRLFNRVYQGLTPQIVAQARKSQEDTIRHQGNFDGLGR